MNIKKLPILLVIGVLGCGGSTDPIHGLGDSTIRFSADSLPAYELAGRILASSDSLAIPLLIATGGEHLYVGDNQATKPLMVFDRNTGEFVKYAGRRGRGPSEIDYLWSMDFKPGEDTGWLFDFQTRTLHQFDGELLTGRSVRLQNTGPPMSPVWVKDDSIASVGMYEDGRLAMYDSDGLFGRFIGSPPPGDPEVPVPVRQHAYEAVVQTNSKGSLIAVVSQNTDLIEIFNTEGLLHSMRGPGFDEPVYTLHGDDEGNQWLALDDETIKSYVSVSVTDDLVFALYSGQTMEDAKNSSWFSPPARTVYVFSWSGTPLASLQIEYGALKISVSADGQDLYVLYHRPVPMVMHYNVPREVSSD
ncbi:MAG: hypothetical protein F4058_00555 [Rhodothermaceae bacterium]|nr:hypothetical protein [Rhodothermaceae bacterium]MYF64147.1 hypothetical protein [Rhodothermaceae bacterium]MYI83802.1 hypothetical protein [Rhodothermaceae bacterium]